jgi:hypothetical protein
MFETETDASFAAPARHTAEDVLLAQKATYQINLYSGVQHGFAVRVDLKNKTQVFAKESAYIQLLRWFDQWLKAGSSSSSSMKYTGNGFQAGEARDQRVAHDFENSHNGH